MNPVIIIFGIHNNNYYYYYLTTSNKEKVADNAKEIIQSSLKAYIVIIYKMISYLFENKTCLVRHTDHILYKAN